MIWGIWVIPATIKIAAKPEPGHEPAGFAGAALNDQ